jgi:hypothetical protein
MTLPPLPALVREIENCITARHLDAALALCSNLRAAIAAVPAQPVAWLGGDGHPHHISAVQTITERRIYGPWQPLYAAPQAVPVPADMALTDDPWRKLYRRAINEANGLTNYVEDRPELRGAERRLAAIEAEARTLAATFEPTPEKKP